MNVVGIVYVIGDVMTSTHDDDDDDDDEKAGVVVVVVDMMDGDVDNAVEQDDGDDVDATGHVNDVLDHETDGASEAAFLDGDVEMVFFCFCIHAFAWCVLYVWSM